MGTRPPDAIVNVRLTATGSGGRRSGIGRVTFGCPVFFGDEQRLKQGYDCRLYFDEAQATVMPGETASRIPVRFLFPDLVRDQLRVGVRFTLWEGRDIGDSQADVTSPSRIFPLSYQTIRMGAPKPPACSATLVVPMLGPAAVK